MIEILMKCPLFLGINANELEKLLNEIHYQVKKYKKSDVIDLAGSECNSLRVVLKGNVKGEMIDFSGKVLKIEDISAPKPLATAFLFGKRNKLPVNIIANGQVELFVIPKESVIKLMQTNQFFLKNFMNAVSNRAQFLSEKLRFLSFKTIKGKLAHYLLDISKGEKGEIILPQSQEQIAELFAVTRPSLGRVFVEFNQQGFIRTKGRNIEILNAQGLSEVIMTA